MDKQTHTDTQASKHINRHRNTNTEPETETQTLTQTTHKHSQTHTHARNNCRNNTHSARTSTNRHKHRHIHRRKHRHSHRHAQTHTHKYTDKQTHTQTHKWNACNAFRWAKCTPEFMVPVILWCVLLLDGLNLLFHIKLALRSVLAMHVHVISKHFVCVSARRVHFGAWKCSAEILNTLQSLHGCS